MRAMRWGQMRRYDEERCEELSQRFLGVPLRTDHEVWTLRGIDGHAVGFCSSCLCDSGNTVFLSAVAIEPSARGTGQQIRAIRLREKRGRRCGARVAVTYTAPDSIASMRSLIRCGYNVYDPAEKWAGAGRWIYWIKRL